MTGKSPVPKTKEMQVKVVEAVIEEVTGVLTLHPKRHREIASYQFVVTEKTAIQVQEDFINADVEECICIIQFFEIDGQSAAVDLKEIELIRFVPAGVGA